MTASAVPLYPTRSAIDVEDLRLPRSFLEARFCSGVGQYHSPTAKLSPRALESISGAEVMALVNAPQRVTKAQARWAIFSDHLSRRAEDQRQHGRFYALWADLDHDPPELQDAADRLADSLGATVLAYTSASATTDTPKARLLVPLATPCSGDCFEACQRILNDRLEALVVTPDRATERANQVCYLPNRGEFYTATAGEDLLGVGGGFDWKASFARELAAHERAEAERLEKLERRQTEARAKLTEREATGQASPIAAYNAAFHVPLVLEAYGYTRHGNRWLSPLSESGTPGVTIIKDGARWHTAHESDIRAGLPESGDAFDLLKFWEHNGDTNAALRAVGAMMTTEDGRTLTKYNQDAYRESRQQGVRDAVDTLDDLEDGKAVSEELEGRSQRRAFAFTPVGELVANIRPVSWLVRGYVEADSLALAYGEPGHGKSFLAIDLAASIATGTPWHGAETKAGAVFYIAGEGHNGLSRRFKAWESSRRVSLTGVPLYISQRATPLDDNDSAAEVLRVVDDLAKEAGQAPSLIVVDTLARCFGGDENSATDIGAFVTNLDSLRHRWGATVLVVHHSGKDSTRGARGSTALRGAVDTEYRITKNIEGVITLEAGKMKDADTPERRVFLLAPVELSLVDDDGESVWSRVLEPAGVTATILKRPKGANQRLALEALEVLVGLEPEDSESGRRVKIETWRRDYERRHKERDGKEADPKRFKEIHTSLARRGWLTMEDEDATVCLTASP